MGKRKRRAFTGEYKAETARLIRESGKTITCPRPRVRLDDERHVPGMAVLLLAGTRVDHSITWSARSSSEGGIVRPNAFAVLRLITSSNVVGCSIGTSAGLAPLRILSM